MYSVPLIHSDDSNCAADVLYQLISVQAWKIEQDRQKEEEQMKKAKKDKGGKGAERANSSKENKKTTPSTTKKSREDVTPDLAVGTPGEQRAKLQSPTDVFTVSL
jgi:hypothetical protein